MKKKTPDLDTALSVATLIAVPVAVAWFAMGARQVRAHAAPEVTGLADSPDPRATIIGHEAASFLFACNPLDFL